MLHFLMLGADQKKEYYICKYLPKQDKNTPQAHCSLRQYSSNTSSDIMTPTLRHINLLKVYFSLLLPILQLCTNINLWHICSVISLVFMESNNHAFGICGFVGSNKGLSVLYFPVCKRCLLRHDYEYLNTSAKKTDFVLRHFVINKNI